MPKNSQIYCFRATWELSNKFDLNIFPDWLRVETDWQGYKISTVPWIADVAQVMGILNIGNTPYGWIFYLESLGFRNVKQVSCEDMFEDKLYF